MPHRGGGGGEETSESLKLSHQDARVSKKTASYSDMDTQQNIMDSITGNLVRLSCLATNIDRPPNGPSDVNIWSA